MFTVNEIKYKSSYTSLQPIAVVRHLKNKSKIKTHAFSCLVWPSSSHFAYSLFDIDHFENGGSRKSSVISIISYWYGVKQYGNHLFQICLKLEYYICNK